MTPRAELMIARVVAALLGAAFGTILAYFVGAAAEGANGALPFGYWLSAHGAANASPWALFGAIAGYAVLECGRIIRRQ